MARRKRASMREGPLADLFRATDDDQFGEPSSYEPLPEMPTSRRQSAAATPRAASAPRRRAEEPVIADDPESFAIDRETPIGDVVIPDSSREDDVSVYRADTPPPRSYEESGASRILLDDPTDRPAYGRDEPSGGFFDDASPLAMHNPVIRVIGVGGAGVNAINRMVESGIHGVEFMAINTDLQSLQASRADLTVHIGGAITRGLGSGSDPALGHRAAFEEQDRIKRLLKGSDMVFVAAGAGGGTGTGAAPVVARLARDIGALTVGIVTRPFRFEGTKRNQQANDGIEELAKEVDTLIVVPNERLLSVLSRNTSMVDAFSVADDVLRQGVQGISDLITLPAIINLDFADVRTTMRDAGPALLGIGMGSGDNRAQFAAERAISSPLLETSIDGARSILLSITGGGDLSLLEVSEAASTIQEAAHPEANIIFGANVDESLGEQIWITVIATRFDEKPLRRSSQTGELRREDGAPARRSSATDSGLPALRRRAAPKSRGGGGLDVPEFDIG